MKTVSLTKKEISDSIILLLGSNITKTSYIKEDGSSELITGVYNFKCITEGIKFRIDKIVEKLSKEETSFNQRLIKTNKEFYIKECGISFTEEQLTNINSDNYIGTDITNFFEELSKNNQPLLEELKTKINDLFTTKIEIEITPFSFEKISDLSSADSISYKFIYDNFTE